MKNQAAVVVVDGAEIKVIDPATYVAGVFAEHRTKLDALKEADKAVTYDIQTTAGLALAKSSRMSAVRVRTGIEEQRKTFKAPLLAAGKQLDEVAKALTAEIQPLEDRHGVAIAAEEQRLEAIRAAKAEEERQRLAALEAKVQAIRTLPDSALMLGSEQIAWMLDELQARVPTMDEFAELTGQALAVKASALVRLTDLHQAALAREAEALRLEEERRELLRLREAQALRDKQEAERLRQERARQQAEQEKLAAEQAEFQRQREELQAQIDAMDREPDPVVVDIGIPADSESTKEQLLTWQRPDWSNIEADEQDHLVLPCPFCGRQGTLTFSPVKDTGEPDDDDGYVCVVCNVNRANGGCGASSGYAKDAAGAVRLWNRRTTER